MVKMHRATGYKPEGLCVKWWLFASECGHLALVMTRLTNMGVGRTM